MTSSPDSSSSGSSPSDPGDGIAAIVVSYQSAATIDDCLTRLRAAQGVSAIRVVDNHSSDGTLEIVQRHADPNRAKTVQ